jgi:hypothetical protein
MSVKIQINCVKALETLLNADPEFEVEFRKAVLLEYERKHILPTIEARVKAIIEDTIANTFATSDWQGIHLKPKFKEQVEKTAHNIGADAINQAIRDQIKATMAEYVDAIDSSVKRYVDTIVVEKVRASILKKLGK